MTDNLSDDHVDDDAIPSANVTDAAADGGQGHVSRHYISIGLQHLPRMTNIIIYPPPRAVNT